MGDSVRHALGHWRPSNTWTEPRKRLPSRAMKQCKKATRGWPFTFTFWRRDGDWLTTGNLTHTALVYGLSAGYTTPTFYSNSSIMANLKLQGSTYHARLTVPKDVRLHFGNKAELWRTTDTGDKRLADIRGAEIVAAWKRQVYAARNGVQITEWTKSWAKEYREADARPVDGEFPSDRVSAEFALVHELEDLVQDRKLTLPEAKAAYEIATGRRVILADHKDDYLNQYRNHSIKTKAAYQAAVGRFLARFPDDHTVTPKALTKWVIDMADTDGLAAKTITRMIGQARSFWSYLGEREIVKHDPKTTEAFNGLTVPKTAAKQVSHTPFTPQEVVGFLRSPVAQADAQLTLLITIAMYTGARIEEVAMLKKTDLDLDQAVIHFRGTKTKAAHRQVPMHPVLIPALSATLAQNDDFVIAGPKIDKREERGKAMGKRFGRLKTAMGFKSDKVFHSIRGTVSTLFEQAYVVEGVAADIIGHEKQTMTYGLYSGGTSMEQKREAVHKLKYPH